MNSKIRKWTEGLYIICLAIYLAYRSFFNTMIRLDYGIQRFKECEKIWLLVMFILLAVKVVYLRCYSVLELVIVISFCLSSALAWSHARVYWFAFIPFAIVCAKGVSFDKIIRTFLITVGSMIGLAMVLALTNVITNLGYVRYVTDPSMPTGVRELYRYAFGTTYPTTFSEFVFFLSAAWIYIWRKKLKVYDIVLLIALAVLLYKGADAITDTACLILLIVAAVFSIIFKKIPFRVQTVIHKISLLLVFLMPVCAVLMTALMIGYDESKPFWNVLDTRLHLRLSLGHTGMERYGINLFGAKVKYHMTGGDVSLVTRTDYFNMDCSYHMILINYGLVVLVFIVGMFTATAWKAWKEKELILLLIIAVISLECIMENRLIQPQYNIFLLLFFSDIQSEHGKWYSVFGHSRADDLIGARVQN